MRRVLVRDNRLCLEGTAGLLHCENIDSLGFFLASFFHTNICKKKGKNKSLKPRSTQKEVWGFVRFIVTVQTMVMGCCLAYAAYMLQTFQSYMRGLMHSQQQYSCNFEFLLIIPKQRLFILL